MAMMKATLLAMCMFAVTEARSSGLRPNKARGLQSSGVIEEIYFSEKLAEGETATIFETGPFKYTASCKTIVIDYRDYYYYYSDYSYDYSYDYGTSSSIYSSPYNPSYHHHYQSSGHNSSSSFHNHPHNHPIYSGSYGGCYSPCYSPCSGSSSASGGGNPCGTGDDTSYSYDYSSEHTHSHTHFSGGDTSWYTDDYFSNYSYDYTWTDNFAALELTYTAEDADFLYGSPEWTLYPSEEENIIGSYEAGESRTQIIVNSWSGDSTLQSMSGYYMSIDGDSTISLHKEETESEYHPLHDVEFPEGVDCMISGILTYVLPTQ